MKPTPKDLLAVIEICLDDPGDLDPDSVEFVEMICDTLHQLGFEFVPSDLPTYADQVTEIARRRERAHRENVAVRDRSFDLNAQLHKLIEELEDLGGVTIIEIEQGGDPSKEAIRLIDDPRPYHHKLGEIIAAWTELLRIARPYVPEFKKPPEEIQAFIDRLRRMHRFLGDEIIEHDRTLALQARADRRPVDAHPEGRKCSSCGKKPARIDDLCKVCARAQGIVVHGKV